MVSAGDQTRFTLEPQTMHDNIIPLLGRPGGTRREKMLPSTTLSLDASTPRRAAGPPSSKQTGKEGGQSYAQGPLSTAAKSRPQRQSARLTSRHGRQFDHSLHLRHWHVSWYVNQARRPHALSVTSNTAQPTGIYPRGGGSTTQAAMNSSPA